MNSYGGGGGGHIFGGGGGGGIESEIINYSSVTLQAI